MTILRSFLRLFPEPVYAAYCRWHKNSLYNPKKLESSKELQSPSGKYTLTIQSFKTGKGTWNFTQGIVYKTGDKKPIATVKRNYSRFPHLFVEGHQNGHDYLICGEDYQGQTVIELDTGERRNNMSFGAHLGGGFCWSSYKFDTQSKLLVVCGCHWACPYEYRFFDFADPMNGWQEVQADTEIEYSEDKEPDILPDGTVRCYNTRYQEEYEDYANDDDDCEVETHGNSALPKEPIVDVVQTFRREDNKLVLVSEWTSEYHKEQIREGEESRREYEEWEKAFKATDPLYLTYKELVADRALSPETYMGIGITYDGWGGEWKGDESRWCRRIITHKGRKGATVDLEWAVKTGPVKLVMFKDGEHVEDRFFEHSAEGMKDAFSAAKEFARTK